MINKKNLWFLTLFSLILVLSIYYITMPNELLVTNNDEILSDDVINIEESNVVSALKVEDDNKVLSDINDLKEKLSNSELDINEKNLVFEEIKTISKNSSLEETIENKIKEKYLYDSFVKIDDDQIRVVIDASEHNASLANEIMRLVQSEFDKKMYISIEFQN